MKKRADIFLVEKGFFESRAKAQAAIDEGLVFFGKTKIVKSSQELDENLPIEDVLIQKGLSNKYVSRGGIKLEGALSFIGLNPSGLIVLDVGVSTGGFSDCLLQQGAEFVVGLDVGTNQIHNSLKGKLNFKNFDNINAKDLKPIFFRKNNLPVEYDLLVGDLSFISVTRVFESLKYFIKPRGKLLFLIKPQFELEAKKLTKAGIVKKPEYYIDVESKIHAYMQVQKLKVLNYFESPIQGGDGNREFFIYATRE